MMKKQLAIIVTALLALAACGSSGSSILLRATCSLKEDYKPYAAELLGPDENSNDVPLVHRNFIEGCMRVGLIELKKAHSN